MYKKKRVALDREKSTHKKKSGVVPGADERRQSPRNKQENITGVLPALKIVYILVHNKYASPAGTWRASW